VAYAEDFTAVATGRLVLSIPYAKLWSPEHPNLYDLRVGLYQDEELLDEVTSYVGLRGIRLLDGRILINGEPTYLKMVLDQGYWPD
jgi:beta-galactosidase/beta-glucuronidase